MTNAKWMVNLLALGGLVTAMWTAPAPALIAQGKGGADVTGP